MKIIRADHYGMCFGVRDAIQLALQRVRQEPLTIFGELVHNDLVLEVLRRRGVHFETRIEAVTTRTAMITAHGASQKAIAQARKHGLQVVEATCPLVRLVHRTLGHLVAEGFYPVVVGKPNHVEVRGLTEDLAEFAVVDQESDLECLPDRPRLGVVAQTTQPIEKVRHLVNLIRQRFPETEVRFIDTVCQPTKQRQAAAVELARQVDVVVVVGGARSNNTRELVATCERYAPRVHVVQTADDLNPTWFAGVQRVGLTAGTSTPDWVIAKVEQWLVARAESAPEPWLDKRCNPPANASVAVIHDPLR
jgi:4-hydroxy-3-methylbut-2-enyl diphosphate reductase